MYREAKDVYVVHTPVTSVEQSLGSAAVRGFIELAVMSDQGAFECRVNNPQPHYWPNDELSHVVGVSDEGDQVTLTIEPDELATLTVWAR